MCPLAAVVWLPWAVAIAQVMPGGDKHGENGGDKDEREQSADHRLDGGVVAEGAEVGVDVHEYQLPSFTVMWTWS